MASGRKVHGGLNVIQIELNLLWNMVRMVKVPLDHVD